MSSTTTAEDLEIPILPSKVRKSRRRYLCFGRSLDDGVTDPSPKAAQPSERYCFRDFLGMFICCSLTTMLGFFIISWRRYMVFDKPEIRLDSVCVCEVNSRTSNNFNSFVIWDIKFDMTNTDNHTLCIPQFEVSVFSSSSNRTTPLLAKAAITPTHTCVGSTNHTSAIGLLEGSTFQTNKTFRFFDLKIHAQFYFYYYDDNYPYVGDLVCKDAEVAFSTSNSSCGCLVGDPFHCYYEDYYDASY